MIRMFSFLMVIMLVSISLCPVATATDAVYEVFAEAGAESEAISGDTVEASDNIEELSEDFARANENTDDIPGNIADESDNYENVSDGFSDVSDMSDEEFFGLWNEEEMRWETEGKLDYSYDPLLENVEYYVKLHSYTAAKDALLSYYRQRDSMEKPQFFSPDRNTRLANSSLRQLFFFSGEEHIRDFTVASVEYEKIKVDVTSDFLVSSGCFVLMGADKSDSIACFSSKEGEYPPELHVVMNSGEVRVIAPEMDNYVRGYDPDGDYADINYGSAGEILVKDSYYENPDNPEDCVPFDRNTRKGFLKFDVSGLSEEDVKSAMLVLHGKLIAEEDGSGAEETSKNLMVMKSYNKLWAETPETESKDVKALTFRSISHASYSWADMPGGFDWKAPPLAHSEFINLNMRFYELPVIIKEFLYTGNEEYIYRGIEFALDFINDAGAATPPKRMLEAANRAIELPRAFFYFIDSDYMNGEAATAMLKYLWQEATFLNSGYLYTPETNPGLWSNTGFNRITTYFPEFTDSAMWRETLNERIPENLGLMIKPDGSYNESTYGYPYGMLTFMREMSMDFENATGETPDYLKDKMLSLWRYMMYISYPDGSNPSWGEGAPSNSKSNAKFLGELYGDDELLFWGTDGEQGKQPDKTAVLYEDYNVATSRTGWSDNAYVLWYNAINGGSHCHRDALHFTFYAKDKELLTDTGMTSYDSKHPAFGFQRSQTKSHNTIEIDNGAQRGTHYPENSGESYITLSGNKLTDFIDSWTDATLNFRHHRNVMFVKPMGYLIVSDYITAPEGKHNYNQTWHMIPKSGVYIDAETNRANSVFEEGVNVQIVPADAKSINATLQKGFDATSTDMTNYVSYVKKTEGDVTFDTLICAVPEGEYVDAKVERIQMDVPTTVATALKLDLSYGEPGKACFYYLSHEAEPEKRNFAEYSYNGKSAYVMYGDRENPYSFSLFDGSELLRDDKVIFSAVTNVTDFSAEWNGNTVELFSNDENITETEYKVYTPYPPQKVKLNGEKISFAKDGDYIIINGDEAESPSDDRDIIMESNRGSGGGGGGGGGKAKPGQTTVLPSEGEENTTESSGAETLVPQAQVMNDISDHWAKDDIMYMVSKGLVNGVGGNSFAPDMPIKRAEVTSLLCRILQPEDKSYENTFADVSADAWYAQDVQSACDMGLIQGYDGYFHPEDYITREEMAVIIMRACKLIRAGEQISSDKAVSFADEAMISDWAEAAVRQAAELGLIKGRENNIFAPTANISRAEAVTILKRFSDRSEMNDA